MNPTPAKTAAGDSTMTAVVLLWFIGALQTKNWAMSMEVAVATTGLLTRVIDAFKDWLYRPANPALAPPVSAQAAMVATLLAGWCYIFL